MNPTMSLRLIDRERQHLLDEPTKTYEKRWERVLQQLWVDENYSKSEWRDVGVVWEMGW